MATLRNDELNINRGKKERKSKAMPYEKYFGEMPITEEQKRKRIRFANNLEILFLFYLVMLLDEEVEKEKIKKMLQDKFNEASKEEFGYDYPPSYIREHSEQLADDVINKAIEHSDDAYYTSKDRARLLAENESNAMWNYWEYALAIKQGYTKKGWKAIIDSSTRESHREIDGTKIDMFEYFDVNGSKMLFPKDTSMGASIEEIANCRCAIEFYKE